MGKDNIVNNGSLTEVARGPLAASPLAPTCERTVYHPGRGHSQDVRWIMDATALRQLLQIAESSQTRRVVLHNASIKSQRWRTRNGHVFETVTMVGVPKPETVGGPSTGSSVENPLFGSKR